VATTIAALTLAGCGSSTSVHRAQSTASSSATASIPVQRARPQVVQPVAGQAAPGTTAPSRPTQAVDPPPRNPSLSQPASVSRAAAKGAPSDAEVRKEVARFQLAIARYHLDQLNLSSALLDPSQLPPGQYNTSIASVYTDACGGVLHVSQLGVANKTLPCGTEVVFRYGGRAIRVPVIDRGPYIAGREWDLTGAAAEALHFPGLGAIDWRIG
jgi:rare lipoprotein A (peptidoglycan hydrolase)